MKLIEDLLASLASLLLLFFVFLIVTFPVTRLRMLFLGNVGGVLVTGARCPSARS
jgi:hypothetical protein